MIRLEYFPHTGLSEWSQPYIVPRSQQRCRPHSGIDRHSESSYLYQLQISNEASVIRRPRNEGVKEIKRVDKTRSHRAWVVKWYTQRT